MAGSGEHSKERSPSDTLRITTGGYPATLKPGHEKQQRHERLLSASDIEPPRACSAVDVSTRTENLRCTSPSSRRQPDGNRNLLPLPEPNSPKGPNMRHVYSVADPTKSTSSQGVQRRYIRRSWTAPAVLTTSQVEMLSVDKNLRRTKTGAPRGILKGRKEPDADREKSRRVEFGFRYSCNPSASEEEGEETAKRISVHEEEKRMKKIQQWMEERRMLLGENTEGPPSSDEDELQTQGRRRSRSEGSLEDGGRRNRGGSAWGDEAEEGDQEEWDSEEPATSSRVMRMVGRLEGVAEEVSTRRARSRTEENVEDMVQDHASSSRSRSRTEENLEDMVQDSVPNPRSRSRTEENLEDLVQDSVPQPRSRSRTEDNLEDEVQDFPVGGGRARSRTEDHIDVADDDDPEEFIGRGRARTATCDNIEELLG